MDFPRRAKRVLGHRPKQHRGCTTPCWRRKGTKNKYPLRETTGVV